MKRVLIGLVFAALCATGGSAGGLSAEDAEREPVIVPLIEDPFEGFYGGLEGWGRSDGVKYYTPPGLNFPFEYFPSDSFGFFLGYNWQSGPLVAGIEARRLSFGNLRSLSSQTRGVTDLRLRGGFDMGNVFVYTAFGYAWNELNDRPPFGTTQLEGPSAGIGIEYNLSEHWFVGADYTRRVMNGISENGRDLRTELETAGFRIGFRF